ncbi:MAG: Alpha-L-arabinofuranosidase precursor, partial [candidate division NC10 bacterium]|nr:Alpha-L-arabinofuranosidase precursor [candidate division NC10 bacterium]
MLAVAMGTWLAAAQIPDDELERGFLDPPDSARPRVWWHWMNGNISREGIQADLEWMKRIGIGGFQNFDAAFNTPQVVDQRLVYMTPAWKDAFKYAATLADHLGLEMAIAGSPGWSESGGPWVPPAQAMKKFVWSVTRIEGGELFTGVLARPPSGSGPFQGLPPAGGLLQVDMPPPPDFYADAAVVAFRTPVENITKPRVAPSSGMIDPALLSDGDLLTSVTLPAAPEGKQAWIEFDYGQPQAIRAITLALGGPVHPLALFMGTGIDGPELLASDDGRRFRSILTTPSGGAPQHTVTFPEVRARYYRLAFATRKDPKISNLFDIEGMDLSSFEKPPSEHIIREFVLHAAPRINRFEDKAAFAATPRLGELATPAVEPEAAIAKDGVIDLTAKMRRDGTLDWIPPAGQWTVLRFGYSLLGINNHPASPEATGLEVDKLSGSAVKAYFENYLDQYKDAAGGLMGKRGLGYIITDSWEAGAQNWTDGMI